MTFEARCSTGVDALDELLGGLIPGDNIVWVTPRNDVLRTVEQAFLDRSARDGFRCTRVESGPDHGGSGPPPRRARPPAGRTPGQRDRQGDSRDVEVLRTAAVGGPGRLHDELVRRATHEAPHAFVVDDLYSMARLWDTPTALAFFSRLCPTMLELGALAYWRAPRDCGDQFLEAVRQVTQCVLELRDSRLHVLKAEGRPATTRGVVVEATLDHGVLRLGSPAIAGRVALALHEVRTARHLTQEQLARLAGVTASAISQAESAHRSLSLETLARLADNLSISLDDLVRTTPDPGYRLVRHDRQRVSRPGVVPLFDDPGQGLRAYRILLAPSSSDRPHLAHKGTELLVVHRGLVQISVGPDTPVLRPGDCVLATSAGVTQWTNLRDEPAVLLWVLANPET